MVSYTRQMTLYADLFRPVMACNNNNWCNNKRLMNYKDNNSLSLHGCAASNQSLPSMQRRWSPAFILSVSLYMFVCGGRNIHNNYKQQITLQTTNWRAWIKQLILSFGVERSEVKSRVQGSRIILSNDRRRTRSWTVVVLLKQGCCSTSDFSLAPSLVLSINQSVYSFKEQDKSMVLTIAQNI